MSCETMMRSAISDKTKEIFPIYDEDDGLTNLVMLCAKEIDLCVSANGGECLDVCVGDSAPFEITVRFIIPDFSPDNADDPFLAVFHVASRVSISVTDNIDEMLFTIVFRGVWADMNM